MSDFNDGSFIYECDIIASDIRSEASARRKKIN